MTGESVAIERNNQKLKIDWSRVFVLDGSFHATYDVTIGSWLGFSDISELRQVDSSFYELTLPRSTLVTPTINEIFVSITCKYAHGLYNVYNTNYKL